jgi:hypothetical protein
MSPLIGWVHNPDVVGCGGDAAPGARMVCFGSSEILGVAEVVGMELRYLGSLPKRAQVEAGPSISTRR